MKRKYTKYQKTKQEQIKDLLEYVPNPTTTDIYNVAKKVGCTTRLVYYVLERREVKLTIISKYFNFIKDLYELFSHKTRFSETPTLKDNQLIDDIEELLGIERRL